MKDSLERLVIYLNEIKNLYIVSKQKFVVKKKKNVKFMENM